MRLFIFSLLVMGLILVVQANRGSASAEQYRPLTLGEYVQAADKAARYYQQAAFYARLQVRFPDFNFTPQITIYDSAGDFFAGRTVWPLPTAVPPTPTPVPETPFKDKIVLCEGCDAIFIE